MLQKQPLDKFKSFVTFARGTRYVRLNCLFIIINEKKNTTNYIFFFRRIRFVYPLFYPFTDVCWIKYEPCEPTDKPFNIIQPLLYGKQIVENCVVYRLLLRHDVLKTHEILVCGYTHKNCKYTL